VRGERQRGFENNERINRHAANFILAYARRGDMVIEMFDVDLMTLMSIISTENMPTGTPGQIAAGAINVFSVWLERIGYVVVLVGTVKFALGVQHEDAREKINAILIMVSGFMVVDAVTGTNIFAFDGNSETQYKLIMDFIGGWITRVGAATIAIGGTMLAFAIRDSNNPTSKIAAIKTMAAGGITISAAGMLYLFVR
jgi:hypothetical protein